MVVYVAIYIACVYVYVLQGHMLILIIAHALLISLSCRPIAPSYTKLTGRNVLTTPGLVDVFNHCMLKYLLHWLCHGLTDHHVIT